jgi:hypothetical protein
MTAPSVTDEKHSVRRCQLKDGESFTAEKNQTLWRSRNMKRLEVFLEVFIARKNP